MIALTFSSPSRTHNRSATSLRRAAQVGGLGIHMPSKATFVAQAVPPFSTRGQVYDKDKTKKATPPPPTPRHEPLGPAADREQRPKDTAAGMSPAPAARDEEDVPSQPPALPPAPPQLWGPEPEPYLPAAATPAASSPPDKPSVPTAGAASQPRISRETSSNPNTNTSTGTPAAAPPTTAAVAVASMPKPWEAAAANSQAPPAPPAPEKPPPRHTPAASSPPAAAPSPLPQPQPQAAGRVPHTPLPTDMLRLTGGSRKHLVGRVTLRTFFPAATEAVTSARAGSELVRLHRVREDGVTVTTYNLLLSYSPSKGGKDVRLTGLASLVADMGLLQGAYVRLAWGPPTLRAAAGPGPAVLDQRVVVIEQVAGVA